MSNDSIRYEYREGVLYKHTTTIEEDGVPRYTLSRVKETNNG